VGPFSVDPVRKCHAGAQGQYCQAGLEMGGRDGFEKAGCRGGRVAGD